MRSFVVVVAVLAATTATTLLPGALAQASSFEPSEFAPLCTPTDRSVLYGHPLTSNATQKGTDVMSLHPNFASVPSWRSCTAGKHIFSAAMSAKHMGNKRGVPRE